MLEAQREESLRNTVGDFARRGILEREFMEDKRDRCQLEVSLCSQVIDHLEQRWIMRKGLRLYVNPLPDDLPPSDASYYSPSEAQCHPFLSGLEAHYRTYCDISDSFIDIFSSCAQQM